MPRFYTCLFFCILHLGLFANPDYQQGNLDSALQIQYTDYLPKCRQTVTNFMITKVDYASSSTILHFRYVVDKDKDVVKFYGKETENAWVLSTPRRPGVTLIEQRADVNNIRINNQLQVSNLAKDAQVQYNPQRGDIVSCEILFENLPSYVRSIDMIGGDNENGAPRFAFADLMLKTSSNPTLGTAKNMETVIDQFYVQQKAVRYPNIKEITSLEQEKQFQQSKEEIETRRAVSPLEAATEPIDYMPKMLSSISDLRCRERVILQNLYFEEDATDFSRKSQAAKTLDLLVEYLNRYPTAHLVLHGHTDVFGDEYKNLILSKERVLTVKRAINLKGIDKARIITLYHGGTQPLPLYQQGGAMNRRVEAEIICNDDKTNQ